MWSSIRAAATVALALGASVPLEIAARGGSAVAQTTNPSPGAAGMPSGTQAPVGHRQPRPGDLPPETDRQKKADEREAEEQRRLDRVLRNICRGC